MLLGLSALVLPGTPWAAGPSDWARVAQNPMADAMKLPIESQFEPGYGNKEQLKYSLLYHPSMVSQVNEDWIVANRLNLPFIYQPGREAGEKDSFGLGDTTYESFMGPVGERSLYWGVGPAFQLPTATDPQLGTRKWSAGLAATATLVKGPIVAGIRANHLWSFAGKDDRPDVNLSTIEYFLYANLGKGWWVGTSPVNTANWEAASGETWTIPLGGGIGKVVIPNRIPVNLKLEAYSYTEAPAGSADWSLMLTCEFLYTAESFFKR
ncbi:hypothetical protein PDESU_06476 [Pontiella desulfatans]|uniref:Neuromedin U n=1 Tax=Pontiella desulfatans TaxID=2750659 RepID=A0A6C2UES7_PONDE|nr:hypothetical protein PDESU_06476 [Pontiella desulfatans]